MTHTWQSPKSTPFTHLTLADGTIRLEGPEATTIGRSDLLRIRAESGSNAVSLAHRNGGVQLVHFTFAAPDERDAALARIEEELDLERTTKESASSWAQAVQPGLYLLATLMITLGLAQGLAQGATGVDGTGRTAAKAGLLLALGEYLGPTGVLILGGLVAGFFLLRTVVAIKGAGTSVVLEPG